MSSLIDHSKCFWIKSAQNDSLSEGSCDTEKILKDDPKPIWFVQFTLYNKVSLDRISSCINNNTFVAVFNNLC